MLHEVVCGSPPFADDSATPLEAYLKLQQRRPPTLRARGAEVSPALSALAEKALARDPEERFTDAGELRDALDAALAEGLSGKRRPLFGLLFLLVVATAAAYLVLSALGAQPPPDPLARPSAGASLSPAPTPSVAPSPRVPASQLLVELQGEPDAFRRAEAAWDWLSATPRAEGHERVRAALRAIDRPLRTRDLPQAARLIWLADGRLLASTRDGQGFVWEPKSDVSEDLPGFKSGCSAISPAHDRRSYAVLGNLRIEAWIYPEGQRVELPLKAGGISLTRKGDLVVGHLSGQIEILNARTGHRRAAFQAHATRIYQLQALAGGKLLTASRRPHNPQEPNKETLKLWSKEHTLIWSAPIARRVDSLSLDRAGRFLVVKMPGGLIARLDLVEQQGPFYFRGELLKDRYLHDVPLAHVGEVTSVKIDPTGSHAYSTAWLPKRPGVTQMRIWDARQGTVLETREGAGGYSLSDLSLDGRYFAAIATTSIDNRRIEVWAGLPPR